MWHFRNNRNIYRTVLFILRAVRIFFVSGVRIGQFSFDGRPVRERPLQKGGDTDETRKQESKDEQNQAVTRTY